MEHDPPLNLQICVITIKNWKEHEQDSPFENRFVRMIRISEKECKTKMVKKTRKTIETK